MPGSVKRISSHVLHIRPVDAAQAQDMDAVLAEESLEATVCGDVYTGLARLCGDPGTPEGESPAPRAVLVCIDDLGDAELEFFSLVSRFRPDVPVYVYGEERFLPRLHQALEAGAAGFATRATIQSIRASVASRSSEDGADQVRSEERALEPPAAVSAPLQSEVIEPEVESGLESDMLNAEPEDDVGGPVRVPWLRYSGRPVRAAPPRSAPPEQDAADVHAPDSGQTLTRPRQPLLTDEELQALIGDDDIAAIAPEEPGNPEKSVDSGGGTDS